jgi:hypothetical protein
MPTRWRRCAGAILITGSIFSTYGANSAAPACAEDAPADALQLIARLAVPAGQRIRYREEIGHPALAEPEVASGTMYVAADGTLVRDQEVPSRQISEVGDTMLATRAAPGAEATLYPILGEVRPMLLALRRMLAGNGNAIAAAFATDLAADATGWVLTLRPRGETDGTALSFAGCGDSLRAMQIPERDGVVRSIAFSPWR